MSEAWSGARPPLGGVKLGQRNDEVYEKLMGLGEEERDGLRERGIT